MTAIYSQANGHGPATRTTTTTTATVSTTSSNGYHHHESDSNSNSDTRDMIAVHHRRSQLPNDGIYSDHSTTSTSSKASQASKIKRNSSVRTNGSSSRTLNNNGSINSSSKSFAERDGGSLLFTSVNSAGEPALRHGFGDQYDSEEYMTMLEQVFYMYYTDKRHESGGKAKDVGGTLIQDWRMKDRLKTVSAALVLCLNLGVDPPDIVKTNPCAKLECWVDSTAHANPKALEMIGKNLQTQYETLSIRTRYKQYLDPSVEETKKFCCALRRNAKDERILFHYNGHGVPKPTASGEIWVFNKNYTQYIPISLYDLQSWLGAPSLFVYDCSDAGNIVQNFNRFIEKHEMELKENRDKDAAQAQPVSYTDCIQLAACGSKETLPMNPDLPADLFTCCLTTPIEIAIRFFVLQNPLPSAVTLDMALKIPGRLQERRTPLGELNWIFTAITDTIAWNTLPRLLFKKLFRQDLMVAALFRNFLLAQRIMRVHQCHPISSPELPDTHHHPLWQSWDLAVETVLAQLPHLLRAQEGGPPFEYIHSQFFAEQLTAFEVYLTQGTVDRSPPDQLPIVLQVLLSQVHRLRALILLSKFLDLGPWAVNLALSIGIFPYVLKLLQSAAAELKPVMIFIWARLLAVDPSCQSDLLKDNGYSYFTQILSPNSGIQVNNATEHRAMCAFILSVFCRGFKQGQVVCMSPGVLSSCLAHFSETENPLLRQWACLCISQLWLDYAEAKWQGRKEDAHNKLCQLLQDPIPEVRAAALYALTTFIGTPDNERGEIALIEMDIASQTLAITSDGNSMVRKELLVFLSTYIKRYESKFLVAAFEAFRQELDIKLHGVNYRRADSIEDVSDKTVISAVWMAVLMMSADPHMEVAQNAGIIVDCIHRALLSSPLADATLDLIAEIQKVKPKTLSVDLGSQAAMAAMADSGPSSPASIRRQESYFTASLKRTASVAYAIKHLALGAPTPAVEHPGERRVNGVTSLQPQWNKPPDTIEGVIGGAIGYHKSKQPTSKGFVERGDDTPVIPLTSDFFEWSIEVSKIVKPVDPRNYTFTPAPKPKPKPKPRPRPQFHKLHYFREPQMKPTEADEPGSLDYNHRLWRRNRNERIISQTQPQKERAALGKWDHHAGVFNNGSQPRKVIFHQFESHLVAVDDKDGVSVWDWKHNVRLNQFTNGNPAGTRITDVKLLNEDDVALLLTGSADGVVRIYKNYESHKDVTLVSSWRALTDLLPSNRSSGLIAEWQQGRGTLLVGGDMKVIRVWDAAREICTHDIPARSGSCITSLTSDQVAGNTICAGFGDGAVRVYDRRLNPRDAMTIQYREHKTWIVNIHMQRGGLRELVSGSSSGDIKLWDIRMPNPLLEIQAHKNGLKGLAVHEHAPIFATGGNDHEFKIWNTNGTRMSIVKPYSTFLQQNRASRVSVLTFHPHRMMLACAAWGENHINLYTCDSNYRGG